MPEVDLNGLTLTTSSTERASRSSSCTGPGGTPPAGSSWCRVWPSRFRCSPTTAAVTRAAGRRTRPAAIHDDGDDLAALLEALDLAPAHVVTNSWAATSPCCWRPGGRSCSAPCPATSRPSSPSSPATPRAVRLLQQGGASLQGVAGRIAAGDHEGAARQFVEEVAFGPGAWDNEVPAEVKQIMIRNAPTFLGELQDPDQFGAGEDGLARLEIPVRFTDGSESPPIFALTIDRLVKLVPSTTRETIEGAAHMPQMQAPERYVEATARAVGRA